MPVFEDKLQVWKDNNQDPYGNCCVQVAIETMRLIDEMPDTKPVDANELVSQASRNLNAGITGFMAGAAAQIVSQCHSRGEEFRRHWNLDRQINDEGEKANEEGGVLNPAILKIGI